MANRYDIAIAGGGLSGSLIALMLADRRPNLSVALVEAGPVIGGNHVWSFFATDIAEENRELVEGLAAARWNAGYDVRFPAYRRTLATPYRSVPSENLAAAVATALPAGAVYTGTAVTALDPKGIALADGTRIEADGVIDARGLNREMLAELHGGWQKFAGVTLRLAAPHKMTRPIVMDATVKQKDGYRFVYVLPFSADEVFVEDTYYSDSRSLDAETLFGRIDDYAEGRGWTVVEKTRKETGVLPVVTGGDFTRFRAHAVPGVAQAGVRAGLFQPLTSYSLPDAVRLAALIADAQAHDSASLAALTNAHAAAHWRSGGFYRLLARMLFGAAQGRDRYKVLQRFYALDEGLVERFYAGESTLFDKLRVLAGKPPVPVLKAASVLAGHGAPGPLRGKK